MLWALIRSASARHFYWVPTIYYVFVEKYENDQYFLAEKKKKRFIWSYGYVYLFLYKNIHVHCGHSLEGPQEALSSVMT